MTDINQNQLRPPVTALIYSQAFRNYFVQILLLFIVVGGGWYLVDNTLANMAARHIRTGYGYLFAPSTVPIGESLIHYVDGENSYGMAVLVGALNTLSVSVLGILLCGALGLIIGIARLSQNILVNKLAMIYVESLRNVPLVLQLLIWYGFLSISLPDPSESYKLGDWVFLNNRGLRFPMPHLNWPLVGIILGLAIAIFVMAKLGRQRHVLISRLGLGSHSLMANLIIFMAFPLAGFGLAEIALALVGSPSGLDFALPKFVDNDYVGGGNLTPEFAAMWFGLSVYTSSYVAEAVRAGILSVPKGQIEAAKSLGLTSGQIMRLVILPQALRVIIPPALNQFLNLVKNSSLAVVIGYPELVSVSNSILNHTGQAIECISVMMAIYLVISLSVSLLLNWYNNRNQLMVR